MGKLALVYSLSHARRPALSAVASRAVGGVACAFSLRATGIVKGIHIPVEALKLLRRTLGAL